MRRLLPALLLALALASPARAAVRTAIFFYPWYGNPAHDGAYAHWQQNDHVPPRDIASEYFPARGAYSSSDPRILRAQMRDIARAGVDEVVSSWWGRGSPEDRRFPRVIRAAARSSLRTAIQIEPYPGRTPETVAADLAYLRGLGIRDAYLYDPGRFRAEEWAAVAPQLSGVRLFAQTNLTGYAAHGGFAGFYTYDILLYGGEKFARLCAQAHAAGILCAPSVGPGYAALPATGDPRFKPRLDGSTYDSMWKAAIAAAADLVTITSYNEWSEGTQIEPAGHGGRYDSYDGAYGLYGRAAARAYVVRTAKWARAFARSR